MDRLSSPTPFIDVLVSGSTAWLVLNRPERRNALNSEMWAAIPPLIKLLDGRDDVRAILMRGAGTEAFAAGADISEFGESRNDAMSAARYEAVNGAALASIRRAAKPVIAMVQGHCVGGGLALALAADLRVASRSALFALPPARLGLAYPLDGLRDLVATVGPAAAKDLIFTARRVPAAEALAMGLVDRLADEPEAEALALASAIAEGAPLTITHAKMAIGFITGRPGHEDDAEVARLAGRCFDSADYAEGRAAFLEKRRPRFRGV